MDLNALSQKFESGKGLNFAAIRLPGTKDIYFFYASKQPALNKVVLNGDHPVFVCSPYAGGNLAYHFEADQVYRNDKLIHGVAGNAAPSSIHSSGDIPENKAASKENYTAYVEEAVKAIKSKKLDKVVAARCILTDIPKDFSVASYYAQLCDHYPDACVYYFSINGQHAWIGATPEKLMEVNNGVLSTVALAGTIKADEESAWSQKERDEQSITAGFIRKVFKDHQIKNMKESEVAPIVAGNLKHLYSSFEWKAKKEEIHTKFPKLLSAINPTPAVCGMPAFEASSFISKHEQMERRFYSGFVGMVNGTSGTSLYVNLRSMEFNGNRGILYAGAGITKDSVAEKEWDETAQKMQTLLDLIR